MSTPALLTFYCLAVIAASVLGGLIPILIRLSHTRLQLGISFMAGFMLTVALLTMIPHAAEAAPIIAVMTCVLIGFVVMFVIERFFSFHQHEVAEVDDHGQVITSTADLPDHSCEDHHAHHAHAHPHSMVDDTVGQRLSWVGAAIGMALHSLIDGVALASGTLALTHADEGHAKWLLPGFAVFLVILLHKPLDSLTVITLTASTGFSKKTRHLLNGLFSLIVPVGVLLFVFGTGEEQLTHTSPLIGYALAFSAGTFLCIALSDLLPELHFHSHDRFKLSAALFVGIALAFAFSHLEHSTHAHADHADHPPAAAQDDHTGHDHDDHAGHNH